MEQEQQQEPPQRPRPGLVAFKVEWTSMANEQFPARRLEQQATAQDRVAIAAAAAADGLLFMTDFPTQRVLLRLDLGAPHIVLGADIRSGTASHVEIRSADAAMRSAHTRNSYAARERRLFPCTRFVSPLMHRARCQAVAAGRDPAAAVPAGGLASQDLMLRPLAPARIEPTRYLDVDLQGVWEPTDRLSIERLRFIGFPSRVPFNAETGELCVGETQQQQQQQQQEQRQPSPQAAGSIRQREHDEREEQEQQQHALPLLAAPHHAEAVSQTQRHPSRDELPASVAPTQVQQRRVSPPPAPAVLAPALPQPQVQLRPAPAPPPVAAAPAAPLRGCRIVISGYQNPLRGQIRDKALHLGAAYAADWDGAATHLVCAVAHTPKYNEVAAGATGFIVSADWIEACAAQHARVSEGRFLIGSGGPSASAVAATPQQTQVMPANAAATQHQSVVMQNPADSLSVSPERKHNNKQPELW